MGWLTWGWLQWGLHWRPLELHSWSSWTLPGDDIAIFFCVSEMVMWNSPPMKSGSAQAAPAAAVLWRAGGQDLTEKFGALYAAGRWYLQVKKGTKEQGLVFSPARKTHQVSDLYTNPGQAAACATTTYPEAADPENPARPLTTIPKPTWQAGRKEQKLLPRLCWCAVTCWLSRQAHAYLPDRAIRPPEQPRREGQDLTPPPSSPPTRALIWSKFSPPRTCKIDSN